MKFDKYLPPLLTALLAASSASSFGYSTETHRQMSSVAATNTNTLSANFPFSDWAPLTDVVGSTGPILTLQFSNASGNALFVSDLIAQGAVDEDNFPRGINHFFDPVNGAQLTDLLPVPIPLPLPFIYASPDWAINGSGQGFFSRSFSYADARKEMFLSLTSKFNNDRVTNIGLMFDALGHVLHHIQDMAQPQHVRNENHLNLNPSDNPQYSILNNPSYSRYEAWAESNVKGLKYLGYRIDPLTKPMDYWSVRDPNSPIAFGGLADFTNVNFVSPNRMFSQVNNAPAPDPFYGHPVPLTRDPPVPIESILSGPPFNCPPARLPTTDARCSLTGSVVDFVTTAVTDSLQPGTNDLNRRAAMWSVFDQDLLVQPDNPSAGHYTVNALTFPNAAHELIPRAVGYSAGLIDYFFRGKIDITVHALPDGTAAPSAFDLVNLGDEPLTGTVQLFYDDVNNNRYPVVGTGTEWPVRVNLSAKPPLNSSDVSNRAVLPSIPSQSPLPALPDVYMVVFNGKMGAEEAIGNGPGAVVAKQVTLPMPKIYFTGWDLIETRTEGTDPPPGIYGEIVLSFAMPPDPLQPGSYLFDSYFFNNYRASHVKLNGQDYPPPPDSPTGGTSCTSSPQSAINPPMVAGLGGGTPDSTRTWTWMYSMKNWTNWALNQSGEFGNADQFQDFSRRFPDSLPSCATNLHLNFVNPGQSMGVEYLIGTQSIFKFCIRLGEPTASDPITGGLLATAYISQMRGVGLMDGAIGIFKDPNPPSCPGS